MIDHLNRFVVISGCSSGSKSTLLTELNRRGYATVEEPVRRVVKEEMLGDGRALPWVGALAFVRRLLRYPLLIWPPRARMAAGCSSTGA